MSKTVNSAFQEFNQNTVNLVKERVGKARDSRDWLIKQLIISQQKWIHSHGSMMKDI